MCAFAFFQRTSGLNGGTSAAVLRDAETAGLRGGSMFSAGDEARDDVDMESARGHSCDALSHPSLTGAGGVADGLRRSALADSRCWAWGSRDIADGCRNARHRAALLIPRSTLVGCHIGRSSARCAKVRAEQPYGWPQVCLKRDSRPLSEKPILPSH